MLWSRWHPERLSRVQLLALRQLDVRGEAFSISAISLWELAQMASLGRLEIGLSIDAWLEEIEADPRVEVVALSAKIAVESTRLGEDFHRDPADQIIVATARCHGLRLATADERIRKWGKVPIL